jgi:phosphatidylserine/phosphatidylglycerophosphate/cardiolipin synthase-like enzyme
MTKFLDTTGVSYHLQQLINNSHERLILISPYLKLNERIKQSLEDRDRLKIDLRIVYGKSELHPDETAWLKTMTSIRTSFCKNLHAKCYMNENEAIITSMNLYEFSEVNNNEMGIYISKENDETVFHEIYEEVMRIIRISDEVQITVAKVSEPKPKYSTKSEKKKPKPAEGTGHCVRCDAEIKLDPSHPYCKKCFTSWRKYENPEYEEKYCHVCGSDHKASLLKPVCYKCYKKHKNDLEFADI